jgi:hypothetical protein
LRDGCDLVIAVGELVMGQLGVRDRVIQFRNYAITQSRNAWICNHPVTQCWICNHPIAESPNAITQLRNHPVMQCFCNHPVTQCLDLQSPSHAMLGSAITQSRNAWIRNRPIAQSPNAITQLRNHPVTQ